MRKSLALWAVIGSLSLLGCAEDGRFGREGSLPWHNRTSAVAKADYFGKICASYGYAYKTPEMAECISKETRLSKQEANAEWDNLIKTLETPKSTKTNCRRYGNSIECETY